MATFRLVSFAHVDKIDRCLGICQSLTQTFHYLIPGFFISSHCQGFGLWNLVSRPYMAFRAEKRSAQVSAHLLSRAHHMNEMPAIRLSFATCAVFDPLPDGFLRDLQTHSLLQNVFTFPRILALITGNCGVAGALCSQFISGEKPFFILYNKLKLIIE